MVMKKMIYLLIASILLSTLVYSCASQNQCKKYAKKQRKKKRAEIVIPVEKTFYFKA
jgi:hypothetical protein